MAHKVVNVKNVQVGDIIVVVRNGSRDLIGKHALINNEMKNTVIGAFMTGIRSSNSLFINALLSTPKFISEIEKNLGATINQITIGAFKSMEFNVPTQEEQTAIGNFFKQLDDTIALHRCNCIKFQNLKVAYLESIFSAKYIQNKDKNKNAWEQRKLGEFGISAGGISLENEFTLQGKYKVISIGSYSENSQYTDQGIRVNYSEKTKSKILNKNNLTMILNDKTASGNIIGRVLLIEDDDTYVYNQRTQRIIVNENLFSPPFLYQLLNAENIREKIFNASQGNTQIYVNWSSIKEISYRIPKSLEEQTAIGNFFKQLDDTIALHQRFWVNNNQFGREYAELF